jgi:hypothetical protein
MHYRYGLKMAVALERCDPVRFFSELEKGKVWPPLHGLLVVPTQIFSGRDWRMAVLPSLLGWVVLLGAVATLAMQGTANRGLAWVAGGVAFGLAALSPASRAFATDIMLESLGAGLTALSLALYVAASDRRENLHLWKACALVLTLLFFEKYNYWLLAILAIGVTEAWQRRASLLPWIRSLHDLPRGLLDECRQPLTLIAAGLLVLVIGIALRGPTSIMLFGHAVSLYPPNNVLTAAYVAGFLRGVQILRKTGWQPKDPILGIFWKWHLLPLAFSFLLPQRLAVFFRFLGPTNYGDSPVRDIPGAARFYFEAAMQDYHASAPLFVVALLGLGIALLTLPKSRGRLMAPLALLMIGVVLALLHPNQKSRYLHTWLPMLWVLAGAGMANLLLMIPSRAFARAAGGAFLVGLVLLGGNAWSMRGHSPDVGHVGASSNLLDLSESWLNALPPDGTVLFLATQSCKGLVESTFLMKTPEPKRLKWADFSKQKTGDAKTHILDLLNSTPAQTLVTLEIPEDSEIYVSVSDAPAYRMAIPTAMEEQKVFQLREERHTHGTRVRVWSKAPDRS